MKVMFIFPSVGIKPHERYPSSWIMEPLAIAALSALTPPGIEKVFYDDRLEDIPYDEPADLVAISIETYSAKRAYQIADRFRQRGIPVVMGGFHATLAPDEVALHADAVVLGEAEHLWPHILQDVNSGQLKKRYQDKTRSEWSGTMPDRSIFKGKRYPVLSLVETGRGCRFNCDFCAVAGYFQQRYTARPIQEVIKEVQSLKKRCVFFVDDNFCADIQRTYQLLEALIPLKIRWVAQASLHVARHKPLLALMKRSGCMGLLVGLESINPRVLVSMNKKVNESFRDIGEALNVFQKHGLGIYAAFVFGYDEDTKEAVQQTYDFALRHRVFFAAFNHVVPFPGTPLYKRMQDTNRLVFDKWWLRKNYRFGDVAFHPRHFSPKELADVCLAYRARFYRWPSILWRFTNIRATCSDLMTAFVYFFYNFSSARQIAKRQGLPLGRTDHGPGCG